MVNSNQKIAAGLAMELNKLKALYRDQRINLTIIKNEFQDHGKALAFLRRHKDNTSQHKTAHYKVLVESTKTLASKHKMIVIQRNEFERIGTERINQKPTRVIKSSQLHPLHLNQQLI